MEKSIKIRAFSQIALESLDMFLHEKTFPHLIGFTAAMICRFQTSAVSAYERMRKILKNGFKVAFRSKVSHTHTHTSTRQSTFLLKRSCCSLATLAAAVGIILHGSPCATLIALRTLKGQIFHLLQLHWVGRLIRTSALWELLHIESMAFWTDPRIIVGDTLVLRILTFGKSGVETRNLKSDHPKNQHLKQTFASTQAGAKVSYAGRKGCS